MQQLTKKRIFLHSPKDINELAKSYETAFKNAKELYIASAYLTSWSRKVSLCSQCENVFFLVGTDFGITRKKACNDVIEWLPKKFKGNLFATPFMLNAGFHPKIIAWKDLSQKHHCIIGSSNLTEAAFNSNYEANVEISISRNEFAAIKRWLESIEDCQVVDSDWLNNHYKERTLKSHGKKTVVRTVNLSIPKGKKYMDAVKRRRKYEKSFKLIEKRLKNKMILCSTGKITNKEFWKQFWNLWSNNEARIQGSGIQFTGKSANWKQACDSFLEVFKNSSKLNNIDYVVKNEIDKLSKLKNPMRVAWFSEMLCHYFPKSFPLLDNPIKIYLRQNSWKSQKRLSEGGKYIDIARKMREVIRQNKNGPQNMPELDSVIWTWCNERRLLKKQNK